MCARDMLVYDESTACRITPINHLEIFPNREHPLRPRTPLPLHFPSHLPRSYPFFNLETTRTMRRRFAETSSIPGSHLLLHLSHAPSPHLLDLGYEPRCALPAICCAAVEQRLQLVSRGRDDWEAEG